MNSIAEVKKIFREKQNIRCKSEKSSTERKKRFEALSIKKTLIVADNIYFKTYQGSYPYETTYQNLADQYKKFTKEKISLRSIRYKVKELSDSGIIHVENRRKLGIKIIVIDNKSFKKHTESLSKSISNEYMSANNLKKRLYKKRAKKEHTLPDKDDHSLYIYNTCNITPLTLMYLERGSVDNFENQNGMVTFHEDKRKNTMKDDINEHLQGIAHYIDKKHREIEEEHANYYSHFKKKERLTSDDILKSHKLLESIVRGVVNEALGLPQDVEEIVSAVNRRAQNGVQLINIKKYAEGIMKNIAEKREKEEKRAKVCQSKVDSRQIIDNTMTVPLFVKNAEDDRKYRESREKGTGSEILKEIRRSMGLHV